MRKLIKEKKQQPAVFVNGLLQSAFYRHVDTRLFLIKGHYFIIMPMWIKKVSAGYWKSKNYSYHT